MIPKVPNFLDELDANHGATLWLLDRPDDQLHRRPAPGKWSALQCVDHVILTNNSYIDLIRQGARQAITRGQLATRPFRYSVLERIVLWATEPPSRIRIPTPSPAVDPPAELDARTVRDAYEQMYTNFRECLQEAVTANLRKVHIASPFARRVGANAVIVIGVLLAHEHRHLYQARVAATGNAR